MKCCYIFKLLLCKGVGVFSVKLIDFFTIDYYWFFTLERRASKSSKIKLISNLHALFLNKTFKSSPIFVHKNRFKNRIDARKYIKQHNRTWNHTTHGSLFVNRIPEKRFINFRKYITFYLLLLKTKVKKCKLSAKI